MGNYALFIILAGAVSISALGLSSRTAVTRADMELNNHTFKEIAREAAITGLNLTIRRLVADTSSWITNPDQYEFTNESYRNATFSTEVLTPWGAANKNGQCWLDSVQVISTGKAFEGTQHKVDSSYLRTCSQPGGIPPGFQYAIITDDNLMVQQKVTVMSPYDTVNANIHSNGLFSGNGNPYVEGYGTYFTPGGTCIDCANFLPNDDVNGADPNVYEAPEVPMVAFDPLKYKPFATYVEPGNVWYKTGDVTIDFTNFNGITGYGTAENPFIWYIPGNLQIEVNVRMIGFGVIITEGFVTFNGNADIYSSVPTDQIPPLSTTDDPNADQVQPFLQQYMQQGSTLGLFVGGTKKVAGEDISLLVKGRSRIMGTLFLNGGLDVPGDMTVFGSIAGMDDFVLDGKMMIWYEGANEAITGVWNLGMSLPKGIELFAYSEW